jgi:hypothetical protein
VSPYRKALEDLLREWDRLDAAHASRPAPLSFNVLKASLLETARIASTDTAPGMILPAFQLLARRYG